MPNYSYNDYQFASARLVADANDNNNNTSDHGISGFTSANGSSNPNTNNTAIAPVVLKAEALNATAFHGPSFYDSAIPVAASAVVEENSDRPSANYDRDAMPAVEARPASSHPAPRRNHPPTMTVVTAQRVLPAPVQRFKERRKRQQSLALVTGGVVGGVLLGPIGAVFGALAAHGTTKSIGRARQARLERNLLLSEADRLHHPSSPVVPQAHAHPVSPNTSSTRVLT